MTPCTLCDLPTSDPPVTDEAVDGGFCCRGCLEVYRTLGAGVLDDVDGRRKELENGPPAPDAACETAYLSIDGMHCATCETYLETTVSDIEGIYDVRASYATDAMRVRYDPDRIRASVLPDLVSGMGYVARSRDADDDIVEEDALSRLLIGGGMFGMMTMVWYALFLYPTYFGYSPIVELGGFDRGYLFLQLWLLTTLVLGYTGFPILRGAYVSLRAGRPNMDLLVAVAALGSYLYSTVAMGVGRTDLYFDVTVAIVLVVTAGNYYERRVKRRAAGLLSELTDVQVSEATRPDGSVVPIDVLEPGDRVLVKPGERIPLDGDVVNGIAAVDESLVTGESLPRTKRPGDVVRGGTVVTDAPLTLEVGERAKSTLDALVELLWDVQSTRSGTQRFADRLATAFVPLVLVLAVTTAFGTVVLGGTPTSAVLSGLTVVIVSCPCALGLATPLAVATGTSTAATRNVVIASEAVFEGAPKIDVVALDKTGTLTEGRMTVREVVQSTDDVPIICVAAAVERYVTHPVANAIVDAAFDTGLTFESIDCPDSDSGTEEFSWDGDPETVGAVELDGRFERITAVDPFDRGVRGTVGNMAVQVGHHDCFDGWSGYDDVSEQVAAARSGGDLPVVVGWDGVVHGVIVVGDSPREELSEVIGDLSRDGRAVVVLTGDDESATARYRADPRISSVFAGVPPGAKAETVDRLRSRGAVAMVGDGTNDAPALAASDVGIAFCGTKLATDAADAVVIGDDLRSVLDVFEIATATRRRIRENLGWAFVYNGVAIPLAITGSLNPLFAAIAMVASSLLVVVNSTRKLR